jgi:hypothetical protein
MSNLAQDVIEALKGTYYVFKDDNNEIQGIYKMIAFDQQQPTMAIIKATPVGTPGKSHTRKQYFFDLVAHERAPQELVDRLVGEESSGNAPSWYRPKDDEKGS